jgi:hypothetical protein
LKELQELTRTIGEMANGQVDLSWINNYNLNSPPLDYQEFTNASSSPQPLEAMDSSSSSPTTEQIDTSLSEMLQQLQTLTNSPPRTVTLPPVQEDKSKEEIPSPPTEVEPTEARTLQQLPPPPQPLYRWISPTTEAAINNNLILREENAECRICMFSGTKKRTRIHVKQHFLWQFCSCGYRHISRDAIKKHQQQNNHPDNPYEVNQDIFESFLAHMQWANPPTWMPCIPTKTGPGLETPTLPTVPPPMPVPTNYKIPRRPISPVLPPVEPVYNQRPIRRPRNHRRHHPARPEDSRPRDRLAPLSTTITHTFYRFEQELKGYQRTLENEAEELRRDQLTHRRRTPQHRQKGEEIGKLNQAVKRIRDVRKLLVDPLDN